MKIVKSERGVYEVKPSEEHVLGAIRQLLEVHGARVHRVVERIPWGRTTSEAGLPDLICVWPKHCHALKDSILGAANALTAVTMFVEIKRPGGKLRPAQRAWLEVANEIGLVAFKADCLEDVRVNMALLGIKITIG